MQNKNRQLDVLALFGVGALGYLFWKLHLADPALTMLTGSRFDPWLFRGGFLLTGAATLMIIAAVTHQRSLAGGLLGNPLFNWIGTRSYGMYLYHWPIYQIIRKEAGLSLSVNQFIGAMLVTIPLTEASYRFIEMPVRRGAIGNWLRRERRRPSAAVLARRRQMAMVGVLFTVLLGWAGVSIAMAPNRCVGTIECSLVQGPDNAAPIDSIVPNVDDTTPTPGTATGDTSVTPPVSGDSSSTTSSTTSTPATTTTVPVADRPPLAIGESVMLGAKPQLEAGGFEVFAQESKQADWIATVIGQLRAAGRIGKTIVIQSGTNGPVSAEQYDAIMAFLPAAEVTQVVFLTVKAPKPWIDGNNELIRALPAKYPNVTVLDWAGLGAAIEGELSGSDGGVHLRTEKAKQYFANIIFDITGHRELEVPLE
jgi:hypothetical protein